MSEFKKFAVKGNVIDMAVGVVIGTAFGKLFILRISLLNLGEQEFASLAEAKLAGASTLNYGSFIQSLTDFLVISFSVFLAIHIVNKLHQNQEKIEEQAPPKSSEEVELLKEIRDSLVSLSTDK